jgi:phosphopentomutase
MRQVIVLVWPGLGLGSERDDVKIGAQLERVATYVGGLQVPTLEWLGLGNVGAIRGVEPVDPPAASFGRIALPAPLDALVAHAVEAIVEIDRKVHLVGAAAIELEIDGAKKHPSDPAAPTILKVAELAQSSEPGLIIAMPRADECPRGVSPVTSARAVQRLDQELARLFDRLQGREDIMVLVTSDASLSPSTEPSGHARVPSPGSVTQPKWVPILAHIGALPSGIALGDRTPGDFGATAAEALGASASAGRSFLAELLV